LKTDLDYLPEKKQKSIDDIKYLILNEVNTFQGGKSSKKSLGRVSWIILFASYARGGDKVILVQWSD